ncbi:GatB/YqeY domain-containing protein [Phenylobacterium sp.]|uniref:GatB/YqeY domain-containing protein n=1 Tax=Phenylobacterium sp. TaxID=1871053 RepID=UPI00301BA724
MSAITKEHPCWPGLEANFVVSWIINELKGGLTARGLHIVQSPITPNRLHGLLKLLSGGVISHRTAKEVQELMFDDPRSAEELVEDLGLAKIADRQALTKVVDSILTANPARVSEYRSGKDKLLGFFVGQAMKATDGKADPEALRSILADRLAS